MSVNLSNYPTPFSAKEIRVSNVTRIQRENTSTAYIAVVERGLIGSIVYDAENQRGIITKYDKEGKETESFQSIKESRVSEIANKIEEGDIYGGALVWNIRKEDSDVTYDSDTRELYINGVITLPDSAHRHLAIASRYGEVINGAYPLNQWPILIYHLGYDEEKELFSELNNRGERANPNRRAYMDTDKEKYYNDIAHRLIERDCLKGYVETAKSGFSGAGPKFMTFRTISEGLREGLLLKVDVDDDKRREATNHMEEYITFIRDRCWELNYSGEEGRKEAAEKSLLARDIGVQILIQLGAFLFSYPDWETRLEFLGKEYELSSPKWKGNLFSRENPIWLNKVIFPDPSGNKLIVLNRTETRDFLFRKLLEFSGIKGKEGDK